MSLRLSFNFCSNDRGRGSLARGHWGWSLVFDLPISSCSNIEEARVGVTCACAGTTIDSTIGLVHFSGRNLPTIMAPLTVAILFILSCEFR